MSVTQKLRRERDIKRGTEYGRFLDQWVTNGVPITDLYNQLVQAGRHQVVPKPPELSRRDGAS